MVLVGGIFATHSFRPKDAGGLQKPLREFPSAIGISHSEDRPFEKQVVKAIGAMTISIACISEAPFRSNSTLILQRSTLRRQNSLSQKLPSGVWMGASPFHPCPNWIGERTSRSCKRIPGGTGSEAEYGPPLVPVTWTDRGERILG
jgi:hypothetical protein